MSLVRLQAQKMCGLVHPHTNNWVERSKAIKRLRLRLRPIKEQQQQQQQQQQTEVGGKDGNKSGGASSAGGVAVGGGDPYMKLEITKEHINAISDFSELL